MKGGVALKSERYWQRAGRLVERAGVEFQHNRTTTTHDTHTVRAHVTHDDVIAVGQGHGARNVLRAEVLASSFERANMLQAIHRVTRNAGRF